ncbi:MAG: 3'-5' exoribonuclease [Desulfovibrio sp.]|nr:3'-5' exoribonuclease [Desulfovibrio sp.]
MVQSLVAIDFETSGRERNSACALGLCRIDDRVIQKPWYTLLRPPSSRVLFTHIHHLTWEDVKDAPRFPDVWPTILDYVSGASYFIAHNAPFDRGVLTGTLEALSLPKLDIPFLCTLKGARKALPKCAHKSLDALCRLFAIPLNHHNALSDACACAKLYLLLTSMGVDESMMRISTH